MESINFTESKQYTNKTETSGPGILYLFFLLNY